MSPCLFRYGYTSPACSNLAQVCLIPLTLWWFRRGGAEGGPNDRVEWYPSSALHPFVPSALDGFLRRTIWIHGEGPESELTIKALQSVCDVFFFCHFPIRCSGSGVVLIVSIPDIWVLPHFFLYSDEYRLARNTVYYAILSDQMVVGCPLGVPISYYKYSFFSRTIIHWNALPTGTVLLPTVVQFTV